MGNEQIGEFTLQTGKGIAVRLTRGDGTLTLIESESRRERKRKLQQRRNENELDVSDHEHSMTVYSTVYICGQQVGGTLYAVMDGRLRGFVEEYDVTNVALSYTVSHTLLIHGGESEEGDLVRFEFLRTGQNEAILLEETISFSVDGNVGTLSNPFQLSSESNCPSPPSQFPVLWIIILILCCLILCALVCTCFNVRIKRNRENDEEKGVLKYFKGILNLNQFSTSTNFTTTDIDANGASRSTNFSNETNRTNLTRLR